LRLITIRYVIIALAFAIAWLLAGRQLALLLDRFLTLRVASFPVTSIRYDGGGFVIENLSMTFGSTNNLRSDLSLHSDSSNRVVLSSGGRSFVLGPRTNPIDPSGRPEIDLVPEAGDEVSFTGDRSLVGWPTPFEFNFMTRSPWWKRYVYYRLVWSKGFPSEAGNAVALRAGLLHPRRMDRAGYDVEWADRPAPDHHSACDVRP
jgi:hypothetical protein